MTSNEYMPKGCANDDPNIELLLVFLSEQLPPVFGRSCIDGLFPGVISSKSQANIDSAGEGPPAFRHGRLIFYNRDSYLEWLRKRIKSIIHIKNQGER